MPTFTVLADPTRVRILDLLCEREWSVGEMVKQFKLTQPAVSQHLKVLKDAGFVASRVDAQRRIYRVRPEPLKEIDGWLERYRKFWSEELDSLERHLESKPE
jgi:DNA-binding transcriptional ArsR family regulator